MLKILAITAPLFMIIGAGFAAVRLELFSKSEIRVLGRLVINLALPALLFKALSQRSFAEIVNIDYLLAYALGSLVAMGTGVCVAYFGQKKSLQTSALYGLGMSCSNSGFIGYPIAQQLVGPSAAVALALNMMVENMLMLPLAMVLAESGKSKGAALRSTLLQAFSTLLRSPIILSIVAGFIFAILEIRPAESVTRAIDMFAMTSAPIALFVIGGTLVGLEIEGMIGDVLRIVVGKLLIHPLAVFTAVMLLPFIAPQLKMAAVIFACVPMLSIYPILGQRYHLEGVCAAALMGATVTSFFSITVWLIAVSRVFPGNG
jgi:malonate transporter